MTKRYRNANDMHSVQPIAELPEITASYPGAEWSRQMAVRIAARADRDALKGSSDAGR